MFKIETKFNGKKITNSRQLERELNKSINSHIEKSVGRAAGPSVSVKKTCDGFVATGTEKQLEKMRNRLKS